MAAFSGGVRVPGRAGWQDGGMPGRIERIKACLNGSRRRAEHPAVPIIPTELAREAAGAVAAGAEAVHLHPRSGSGAESLAGGAVAAAVAAVRQACPGTPVGVSTALWIAGGDAAARELDRSGVAAPRLLHGEQAACWPLVRHAGRLGLPTRIGLEDTTTGPEGQPVSGNAELTRLALAIWTAARR